VAQHFQNQVGERTEQLNHNLEKEAVVMRIITIVTLIYLPATFVSVGQLQSSMRRIAAEVRT